MKQIPAKIPPHRKEDIHKSFYLVNPNTDKAKIQFIAEFLILDGAEEPLKKALKLQSKTPGTVIYEGWHGGRDLNLMTLINQDPWLFDAGHVAAVAAVNAYPNDPVRHAWSRFEVSLNYVAAEGVQK